MSHLWNWEVLIFPSPLQCSRCATGMKASIALGNQWWKNMAPAIIPVGCSSLWYHLNRSPVALRISTVAWDYFKHTKGGWFSAEEFTLKRTSSAWTWLWFWSHPLKTFRHFIRVTLRIFPCISLQPEGVFSLCSIHSDISYHYILLSVGRKL